MPDQRGQLLRAALGFAGLARHDRPLWTLRIWLDSWSGIGRIAVGMHRQGYDLQLTQYDERGWRATFYTTGMEHSPTSATGTGWERTPWPCDTATRAEGAQTGQRGDPMKTQWVTTLIFVAVLPTSCTTMQNTPEQERTWAAWKACKAAGRVTGNWQLARVDANGGRYLEGTGSPYGLQEIEDCLREELAKPKRP